MNNLPAGRNGPCPCGSGKKFKRCCRFRQANRPAIADSPVATLRGIRDLVRECVILRDFVDNIYWLKGKSSRPKWWAEFEELCQKIDQHDDLRGLVNPVRLLHRLQSMKNSWQEIREHFKEGILCTDDELQLLARKVKDEGGFCLSKEEFDRRFRDFFDDPFWSFVPDYARIMIIGGRGALLLSPEIDMFLLMCRCHDQAVLTGREIENVEGELDKSWNPGFFELHANHWLEVRQAVVNACLFVEAFVNGVAHAYRCNPAKPLSPEDDLYLRERAIDRKSGAECEKFVALQDKLHRWVRIISARGETFDKGANPYQAF